MLDNMLEHILQYRKTLAFSIVLGATLAVIDYNYLPGLLFDSHELTCKTYYKYIEDVEECVWILDNTPSFN